MSRNASTSEWERDGLGADGLHPALVALRDQALGRCSTAGAEAGTVRCRRVGRLRLADAASRAVSPPVTAVAAFAILAAHHPGARPWLWAGVHVALAVLTPMGGLLAMLRRGEISDLEVTARRQRGAPLLLTTLCAWFSFFVLDTAGAPSALSSLALAYAILGVWLLFISRSWKISIHSAGVALAGTLIWALTGSPLWLVVGTMIAGIARIALGRHTVGQVLAGVALGAGVAAMLARGFVIR